jgi:hypothetical protein
VWDAIEDAPAQAENIKLRSALMMALKVHIAQTGLSQSEAAKLLGRAPIIYGIKRKSKRPFDDSRHTHAQSDPGGVRIAPDVRRPSRADPHSTLDSWQVSFAAVVFIHEFRVCSAKVFFIGLVVAYGENAP